MGNLSVVIVLVNPSQDEEVEIEKRTPLEP
jgi:hypothetical protein